jgi:CheY-like chemotaxis protein
VLCAAVVLRLLSRAGAAVTLVLDGAQAVQQCAAPEAEFDLILMDLEMPVLDGVSAAVEIKALGAQRGRSVPAVALSANCSDAVRDRCAAVGMVTMAKPLRVEHLQALRAYALC